MKRLILMFLVLCLLSLWSPAMSGAQAVARPDIFLIITDDQRADTLFAMPNVMALAARGTQWSNAFAVTPLCCPARTSLLTGRYPVDIDVLRNSPPHGGFFSFDDSETLAVWLHRSGYRTALFGKYLNGYPTGYVPPGWDTFCPFVGNGGYYGATFVCNGAIVYTDKAVYSTDWIFEHARAFCAEDTTKPCFAMISVRAPHTPYTNETQDSQAFKSFTYTAPSLNEDTSDKAPHLANLPERDNAQIQSIVRKQLRTLLSVDRNVGELVANINWSKTVIVYTSDHGFFWGDYRLTQKGAPYDPALRIPLVMVAPGGKAGVVNPSLITHLDITSTLNDLARAPAPAGWQWASRSFKSALLNGTAGNRAFFLIAQYDLYGDEALPGFIGVRDTRYKLLEYSGGFREFYDLQVDPFELDNRINDPTYTSMIASLEQRIVGLRAKMDVLGWREGGN